MRTNVVIDDKLMERALKIGKHRTKKSAIEAGLCLLVQKNSQARLKDLKGKVDWEGDLDEMRKD